MTTAIKNRVNKVATGLNNVSKHVKKVDDINKLPVIYDADFAKFQINPSGNIGKIIGDSQTSYRNKIKNATEGAADAVSYKRPSGFRKGVKDKVWGNAKNDNGNVIDPLTGEVMDKSEPWDMGHKPGFEFKKNKQSAEKEEYQENDF